MATTTNFGWETPDDTDLVKDGAAAMRTLGNSIDTSFVDLKGGTSGQMLTKASNTDLDYTWVTPQIGDITAITATSPLTGGGTTGDVTVGIQAASTSQSGAVQLSTSTSSTSTSLAATASAVKAAYDLADAAIAKAIVDAKGDIIAATGADTVSRLAVGTNNQVLVADSSTATGLKWATPASSGGLTLVAQSSVTSQTSIIFNNCFSSTYQNYLIVGRFTGSATSMAWRLRVSGTNATASDYTYQSFSSEGTSNTSARATGAPVFYGPAMSSGDITHFTWSVFSPFEATQTGVEMRNQSRTNTASNSLNINVGAHTLSNSYDGFEFYNTGTGNFTGSLRVYGYQNS